MERREFTARAEHLFKHNDSMSPVEREAAVELVAGACFGLHRIADAADKLAGFSNDEKESP